MGEDVTRRGGGDEATLRRLLESLRLLTGAAVDCAAVRVNGDTFVLENLRVANFPAADFRGRLAEAGVEIDFSPLLGERASRPTLTLTLRHQIGVIDVRGPIRLHLASSRAGTRNSFSLVIRSDQKARLEANWRYGALDGSFRLAHDQGEPLALLWRLGEAAMEMVLLGRGFAPGDWIKLLDSIAAPALRQGDE